MELSRQIKSHKEKITIYLIVLFVIMATDTQSLPFQSNQRTVFIAILAVVAYAFHITKSRFVVSKDELKFLIIVCLIILLAQLWNADTSLGYENKICLLLLGYTITKKVRFDDFIEAYINIMMVIAVVSLVVWMTVIIGMSWWNALAVTGDVYSYHSLFITMVPVNAASRYRVYGPFWEPGTYQVYLNIALLFMLFFRKIDMRKLIIFTAAVIATFSTTGYICMFITYVLYFVRITNELKTWHVMLLLLLAVMMFFITTNEYIWTTVMGKFEKGAVGESSLIIRFKNIQFYMNEWLKNPIFGTGVTSSYQNVVSNYSKNTIYKTYAGSTSTTMREFAAMGGIAGSLLLVLWIKFCKKLSSNRFEFLALFLLFMIFLNTEDFIYSMMFNTIFYYALEKEYTANTVYDTKGKIYG